MKILSSFCKLPSCYNLLNPKRVKGKYCSKQCADKINEYNSRKIYQSNPIFCIKCCLPIPYEKRPNKFCNHSCRAAITNTGHGPRTNEIKEKIRISVNAFIKANPRSKKIIKNDSIICYLTGKNYSKKEYLEQTEKHFPRKKQKTYQLLAKTFNFELGTDQTILNLNSSIDKLSHAYNIEKKSSLIIHSEFNFCCSKSHMINVIKAVGIPRRTLSDATSESILRGTNSIGSNMSTSKYSYKYGYHTDWNGNLHYYRSSYELEYYKILDQRKEIYQCEKLRISYFDSQRNKRRIAVPDILVKNDIYEIKSEYTYDPINMKDKFLSYKTAGYTLTLVLNFKEYPIINETDLPTNTRYKGYKKV